MGFYSDRDSEPLAPLSTPEDSGRVILGPAESMVAGWDAFRATRVAGHEPLRDRYVAARADGKIANKEVADACGFADGSSVSRWASGKGTLAPAHRATLEKLLRNRG